MLLFLIVLFILAPIAEIYVLLAVGNAFGILPVIAACLTTAFVGGWLIRLQGLSALNTARREMGAGHPPVASVVDGVLLFIAAPFLMTPGFLTDAIGFSLLIPQFRQFLARHALREIQKRIERGDATITIHRP